MSGSRRTARKAHPDPEARGAALPCAAGHDRKGRCGARVPFFGTGTTGAVAKRLGREWIGCEREDFYREVAMKRIAKELPLDESALTTMQSARTAPKVAFALWSKPA